MDNPYNTKWALKFQKFFLSIPLPLPYLLLYVDRKVYKKEQEEQKGKEQEEGGEEGVEERKEGEYKHALVGVPSRGYLWVMGRDKEVGEGEMKRLLEKAEELGFDRLKIEKMKWVDSIDVPPYGSDE